MENTPKTDYLIPVGRMDRLAELWERMTKRANKLNVPAPVLVIDPEVVETRTLDELTRLTRVRRYRRVSFAGEAPKLAGWSFIATIQHAGEAGNILRVIPDETLPASYRTGSQRCDHCKVNRKRTDTFVVRNEAGEH